MLRSFSVQGYRNFNEKIEINFTDTRDYRFNPKALYASRIEGTVVKCGLLYGRNAVGKTNFGNALFDICDNLRQPYANGEEQNFLSADSVTGFAEFEYEFEFRGVSVTYCYRKSGRSKLVWESLKVDDQTVFFYNHDTRKFNISNLSLIGAQTLNLEFMDSQLSIFHYVCNNLPLGNLGVIGDMYRFVMHMAPIAVRYASDESFVSNVAKRIIEKNLVKEFEHFLNCFGVDERLIVVQSPSGSPILCFDHQRPIPFAENCSNGTIALMRLFNFVTSVEQNTFLFIDEFDAFYHHDLAEKVIEYIKDQNIYQVLCATHNTDLFSNKVLRPDCLFILSKDHLTSAANATSRELREGHNLEKLYKAGEFDD